MVFRFVIGKTNDSQKTKTVEKEMKKYNDFLRIDYEEEHISSAKKTYDYLIYNCLSIKMRLHVRVIKYNIL